MEIVRRQMVPSGWIWTIDKDEGRPTWVRFGLSTVK